MTIGYAYFGLSGKNTPKANTDTFKLRTGDDEQPNDADQNITNADGGGDTILTRVRPLWKLGSLIRMGRRRF